MDTPKFLQPHIFLSPSAICHFFHLASAGLNEEQQQIQQMATDFANKELLPNMSTWDQQVNYVALHLSS